MTHLDGTGDGNLVVNTTAFPTRSPTNPGFVHLNMVLGLSTDPVLVGPHHARAELVENLKGRLVARKTKLPLKLHGGHAGRLTGDQISGPEPDVQRSVATLHHCSHRQPGVLAALAAAQDARAVFKVERLSRRAAVRAGKAVSPAGFLQVGGAGRIIGEKSLELGWRMRGWEIGAVENIHGALPYIRFAPILALVGVGVNRIGKVQMRLGTVESIWRYPVKGMRGEEIPHVYTGFSGLMGDRIYGVIADDGIDGFPWHTGRDQEEFVLYNASYTSSGELLEPEDLESFEGHPPGVTPVYPDADAFKVSVVSAEGRTYDNIESPDFLKDLEKIAGRSLRIHVTQRGQHDCRPV